MGFPSTNNLPASASKSAEVMMLGASTTPKLPYSKNAKPDRRGDPVLKSPRRQMFPSDLASFADLNSGHAIPWLGLVTCSYSAAILLFSQVIYFSGFIA